MALKPFEIGDVVTNEEMRNAFRVSYMGGMRKSNAYNCLVLISDHTKGLYDDKWHGDELHYTGMGKTGNQVLKGNQNGTLYHSRTNGVELHLFEVIEPREYTYRGVVELCGEPYQEKQPGEDGLDRKVWMFPIKPVSGAPAKKNKKPKAAQDKRLDRVESMSIADLKKIALAHSNETPKTREVTTTETERDQYVSEYAKRIADGMCSLCEKPAPFKDKEGKPYLETHHIVWLSKGGADSVENTVALCPNCHRKMHVVGKKKDVNKLKKIAKNNASK